MISLQTNISTLRNHRDLYSINLDLSESMERLSSGKRINTGADDPSGLGISANFKAQYRGLDVATQNVQDSLKWLETRDRGMKEQFDVLMRMRDLALRASNEAVLTTDDYTRLNNEYVSLRDELTRAAKTGNLNEKETLFHPGKLDVVWIADQTGSMGNHLNGLASAAAAMFRGFAEKKFDLRMAVVGMGAGGGVPDVQNYPGVNNPVTPLITAPNNLFQPAGGTRFWDDAQEFSADVNEINLGAGSAERGLASVYQAQNLLTVGPEGGNTNFRADAQKIFILITDEDSDDAGQSQSIADPNWVPPVPPVAPAVEYFEVPDQLETELINKLGEIGAVMMMASNTQQTPTYRDWVLGGYPLDANRAPNATFDNDYESVVNATGGTAVYLTDDPPAATTWVDEIVSALEAYGGDWDKQFFVGDSTDVDIHRLEFTFASVSADTLNSVDQTSISTRANAQAAVTALDGAIDDMGDAMAQAGYLSNRFQHIIDELQSEYVNIRAANSKIEDADMAVEISRFTRGQIMQQGSLAASAYANAMPSSVLSLISAQGIGGGG